MNSNFMLIGLFEKNNPLLLFLNYVTEQELKKHSKIIF